MSRYSLLLSFLIAAAIVCPALSSFVLHNFDTNGVDNWKGLTLSTEQAHSGSHSGCWANTSSPTSIWKSGSSMKRASLRFVMNPASIMLDGQETA